MKTEVITNTIRDIAEHGTTKISRKVWDYYERDGSDIVYSDGVFWYERGIPAMRIHEWTRKTIRKAYGKAVYLHDLSCRAAV